MIKQRIYQKVLKVFKKENVNSVGNNSHKSLKEVGKNMSSKKLAIIGAGSLGIMTLDAVLKEETYPLGNIVFIDDGKDKGEAIHGVPVIGDSTIITELDPKVYNFVIAVADNNARRQIVEANDISYVNVVHPHASISQFAKLGIGNIILPNVSVDPEAIIHNHVIINKNTSIGHNVEMEDFSQASPGCQLGGLVQICTFLGMGATLMPNIKIGRHSIVGAGAVVTKDLPDYCTAIGTPAKPVKFHN